MGKTLVLSKQEEVEIKEKGEIEVSRNGLKYRVFVDNDKYFVKPLAKYTSIVLQGIDKTQLVLTMDESKLLLEVGKVRVSKGGNDYIVIFDEGAYSITMENPFINVLTYSDTH